MPIKIEPLDKGLMNVQDAALLPEGALNIATNARYRPGDPGVWQAEGRAQVADGDHREKTVGGCLAGLSWDSGTHSDAGESVPELKQIFYFNSTNFATIPAKDDVTSTDMNNANETTYTAPTGISPGSAYQPDVIQYENNQIILTGGTGFPDALVMRRKAGSAQALVRYGLYPNATDTDFGTTAVAPTDSQLPNGGTKILNPGFYNFWITWYDGVNDMESSADENAIFTHKITLSSITTAIDLHVLKSEVEAQAPAQATKVRLYSSLPFEVSRVTESAPISTAFPAGWRVGEFDIDPSAASGDWMTDSDTDTGTHYDLGSIEGTTFAFLTSLQPFPTVALSVAGGQTLFFPKDYPARPATTGDIFEGSVVLNQANNPRRLQYTFPGEYRKFPTPYYLDFQTSENDKINCIRTLGKKCGVFMENSIWRVNWLPTQSDFEFNRGAVIDVVATGEGCPSRFLATKFTMPGFGPAIAFVSKNGLFMTDLFAIRKLSRNIDWAAIFKDSSGVDVRSTLLGTDANNGVHAWLVDNPLEERLEFYFDFLTSTPNSKHGQGNIYYFHYDPDHLNDDGTLAVMGPQGRTGGFACVTSLQTENNQRISVSGDNATQGGQGNILYEGNGLVEAGIASPSAMTWSVQTREIYPAGFGNETKVSQVMLHYDSADGAGTTAATFTGRSVDGKATSDTGLSDIDDGERKLKIQPMMMLLEYYEFSWAGAASGSPMKVNFVGVHADSLGESMFKEAHP